MSERDYNRQSPKSLLVDFIVFILITIALWPIAVAIEERQQKQVRDNAEACIKQNEANQLNYPSLIGSITVEQIRAERLNQYETLMGSISYQVFDIASNVPLVYSDFSDNVIQKIQPTTKFTFQSEHNSVTIDIETGEIETDYDNVEEAGRGAARLFWECFGQELQRIKAEKE